MKFFFVPKNKVSEIPSLNGVYCFKAKKRFLYIGKAVNLDKRVKSHQQSPFWNETDRIGFLTTNNEIEALILESKLISQLLPRYNLISRDKKNYAYAIITKEKFPRIFVSRAPQNQTERLGPFLETRSLKTGLRLLKKAFPFYEKLHGPKPCLECRLGLCPGPWPELKSYQANIRHVRQILKGRGKLLLKNLKKQMLNASKNLEYEKAARIKDQILSLEAIFAYRAANNDTARNLQRILKSKKPIARIEAYDISNIQGQAAAGSLVCFINGKPNKNYYRRFKIKLPEKPNDTAMIKEVLTRRFRHQEWPYPELILIDGGKAQLNAALLVKAKLKLKIKAAALAKKHNKLFVENKAKPILLKNIPEQSANLILRARDQAHYFAKSYHLKLRKKVLLS